MLHAVRNDGLRSLLLLLVGATVGVLLTTSLGGPNASSSGVYIAEHEAPLAAGATAAAAAEAEAEAASLAQQLADLREQHRREAEGAETRAAARAPAAEAAPARPRHGAYQRRRCEEEIWALVTMPMKAGRASGAVQLHGTVAGGHPRWMLKPGHPIRAAVEEAATATLRGAGAGAFTGLLQAYYRLEDEAGAEVIVHAAADGGERFARRFVRPYGGADAAGSAALPALQQVSDSHAAAGERETLTLMVPLGLPLPRERQAVVRSFVRLLRKMAREDGALRLLVTASVPTEAAEADARRLFDSEGELDTTFVFQRVNRGAAFNRGRVLDLGVQALDRDDPKQQLFFFVDVDMVLDAALLDRLRVTTVRGASVSFPICFSLYRGVSRSNAVRARGGYWREFGYGMAAMWRSDYEAAGGFGELDDGWGGEDVKLLNRVLEAGLDVFRAREPALLHVWHPKDCSGVPGSRLSSCLDSAGQNYRDIRQAGAQAVRADELFGGLGYDGMRVFVYDLPAEFNAGEIELNRREPPKIRDPDCTANFFSHEYAFHQYLLSSPFRTTNADEADFFYVPVYPTCFLLNHLPNNLTRSAEFFGRAFRHVREEYPHWNRTAGRDHVFLFSQGFGARMAGEDVWPILRSSIVLTSNGEFQRYEFTPHKDIVIPPNLSKYVEPAYTGDEPLDLRRRSRNLAFFGGSVFPAKKKDHRGSYYSLGVRQYVSDNFKDEPDLQLSPTRSPTYEADIRNSTFCLCPEGWHAWTPRPVEAVLLNCIPVVFSERLELPLAELVNWDEFAIRIRPTDVGHMMNILRAVSEDEIAERRAAMERVWHHFSWHKDVGHAPLSIMNALFRRKMPYKLRRQYAAAPPGSVAPAPPPEAATESEWVADAASRKASTASTGPKAAPTSEVGAAKPAAAEARPAAAEAKPAAAEAKPAGPTCLSLHRATGGRSFGEAGASTPGTAVEAGLAGVFAAGDLVVNLPVRGVGADSSALTNRLRRGKGKFTLKARAVRVPTGVRMVPSGVAVTDKTGGGVAASVAAAEPLSAAKMQPLEVAIVNAGVSSEAAWAELDSVQVHIRVEADSDAARAEALGSALRVLVSDVSLCA